MEKTKTSQHKRILSLLLALLMMSGYMIPQANAVSSSVNVKVLNSQSEQIDFLKDFVLTDLETGTITIEYTPSGDDITASIQYQLPDFYSFDTTATGNILGSYKNYEIVRYASSAGDAYVTPSDNIVEVKVLNITVGAPEAIIFGLSVKLNRNSITSNGLVAWENRTWEPSHVSDKSFVFKELNGNAPLTDIQTPKYSIATYSDMNAYSLSKQSVDILDPNGDVDRVALMEHGQLSTNDTGYIGFYYVAPDPYQYGVLTLDSITIQAQPGFTFSMWDASIKASTSNSENITNDLKCNIASNGQTATFSFELGKSDANYERNKILFAQGLQVYPTQYLSNNNQDNSTLLSSNTEYNFEATFVFKGTQNVRHNDYATFKTIEFTKKAVQKVTLEGIDVDVNGQTRKIYDYAAPNTTNSGGLNAQISAPRETYWNGASIPDCDGKGYKHTMTFENKSDVRIDAVTLLVYNKTTILGDLKAEHKVQSITYTTDKHTYTVNNLSPSNAYFTISAPLNEHILKVETVFDKLVYTQTSPLTNTTDSARFVKEITYSVSSEATPGTLFEVSHKLEDATNIVISPGDKQQSNYILIVKNNELGKCPDFVLENPNAPIFKSPHYQDAVYANGEEAPLFRLKTTANFLGTYTDSNGNKQESGVLSNLKNPVFMDNRNNSTHKWENYFASGQYKLHAVMGDGNWKLTVETYSFEPLNQTGQVTKVKRIYNIPQFSTETYMLDISDKNLFGNDALTKYEVILTSEFAYKGDLDIASMSDFYEGSEERQGDKIFYEVYGRAIPINPLNGLYFGDCAQSKENYVSGCSFATLQVKYDNCTTTKHGHSSQAGMTYFPVSGNNEGYMIKGAELIIPKEISTKYLGELQQGASTPVTVEIDTIASRTGNAEFWVQPGHTAYLKFDTNALQYFNINLSTVKMNGVLDPDAQIVTLGNDKYLKISYCGDSTKIDGTPNGDKTQYAAYKLTFDMFTSWITPHKLNSQIFTESVIDVAPADFYTYKSGGKIFQCAIQGQQTGDGASEWRFENKNTICTDDPLHLYYKTPTPDRNWALMIKGWNTPVKPNTIQGVYLNPGIENRFQYKTQPVSPEDEDKLTTALTIVPSPSSDMKDFDAEITLPRKGETINGKSSTVSQYLSGPLKELSNASSHDPITVTYKIGNNYYSENQIISASLSWEDVTQIHLTAALIKKDVIVQFSIPSRTSQPIGGSDGASYFGAVYSTKDIHATSSRVAEYTFTPQKFLIAGTIWEDSNKDGMMDASEAKLPGMYVELLQDGKPFSAPITTVTNADGTYAFKTQATHNLSIRVSLQNGSTLYAVASAPTATSDNHFPIASPYTTVDLDSVINSDIERNAGLIATQTPPPPIVTATKTASLEPGNAQLNRDEIIIYTIAFKNTTGAAQNNVVIADTIPTHTTYVADSATTTKGSVDASRISSDGTGEILWNVGTLQVDETVTASFRVKVNGNVSDGTKIQNIGVVRLEKQNVDTNKTENTVVVTGGGSPGGGGSTGNSINVTVKKVWNGDDNQKPESISVQLYKDKTAYGDPVSLSAKNNWTYTWSGLSTTVNWTVDEVQVPDGYLKTVLKNGNTVTITNSKLEDIPGSFHEYDHFAYIIGYPDGNVRPSGNITRAEVATIFFRLLKEEVRNEYMSAQNPYSDVNDGVWHNRAISTLTNMGILKGKDATTFAPNANITHAEFAAITARFSDKTYSGDDIFDDISTHWARDYINKAASLGWIQGNNGKFRPDDLMTRAETTTLVNRVMHRNPETAADLLTDMVRWPDNADPSAWYYLAIQEATNSHYYNRKENKHEVWTKLREVYDWSIFEK